MPLSRFNMPKVYLGIPFIISSPIKPINRPIIPDIIPFTIESPAKPPIIDNPKIPRKKYSNALKLNDIFANGGAIKSNASAEKAPPIPELIVATPNF